MAVSKRAAQEMVNRLACSEKQRRAMQCILDTVPEAPLCLKADPHYGSTDLEVTFDRAWQQYSGLPPLTPEYAFDADRNWKVDRVHVSARVAVEMEGAMHRVQKDRYNRDIEKYNRLSASGWSLLRCTTAMLREDAEGFVRLVVQVIQDRQAALAEAEEQFKP